jgi:hypothetical protein
LDCPLACLFSDTGGTLPEAFFVAGPIASSIFKKQVLQDLAKEGRSKVCVQTISSFFSRVKKFLLDDMN